MKKTFSGRISGMLVHASKLTFHPSASARKLPPEQYQSDVTAMSPLLPNSLLSFDDESMIRLVTTQAPKTAANHSKIRSGSDLASKISIANVEGPASKGTASGTKKHEPSCIYP